MADDEDEGNDGEEEDEDEGGEGGKKKEIEAKGLMTKEKGEAEDEKGDVEKERTGKTASPITVALYLSSFTSLLPLPTCTVSLTD